jgi:hypothetical protein
MEVTGRFGTNDIVSACFCKFRSGLTHRSTAQFDRQWWQSKGSDELFLETGSGVPNLPSTDAEDDAEQR